MWIRKKIPQKYIGKKGKCPNCGTANIINSSPEIPNQDKVNIYFQCNTCNFSKIKKGPRRLLGKSLPCPKCKNIGIIRSLENINQANENKNKESISSIELKIKTIGNKLNKIPEIIHYMDGFINEKQKPYILASFLAIFLIGFKYVDLAFLPPYSDPTADIDKKYNFLGCIPVAFYITIISFLVWKQLYQFRKTVRKIFIQKILHQESFIAKFLSDKTFFLNILSILSAIIISIIVLTFIYNSSTLIQIMILINSMIYVYIDSKFRFSFNKIFQKDISNLFIYFFPIVVNVFILSVFVFIFAFIENHDNILEINMLEIPYEVIDQVNHSCIWCQHYFRTVKYIELNIIKLKSIELIGSYLYSIIYISSISIVPFLGISLCFKSTININGDKS